jgi:hypothetical protein
MKPTLVVNPANDRVFAEFAQILVDHGVPSIGDFERRLQAVYPRAAVHPRDLTAELIVIWYVYREGHWVNSQSLANQSGAQEHDVRPTGGCAGDGGFDPASTPSR